MSRRIPGPMRWLRALGTALIASGIVFGIVTFYLFSYGLIINGTVVEQNWFWQGPVLGAAIAIVGAGLVVHPMNRRPRQTTP